MVARFVGDEGDRPGRGVAAVQGSLGTFQDLDAIHVHQLKAQLRIVGEVNLVEVHAHRLRAIGREVVQAYAAQREDRGGVAHRVLGSKVRRHLRDASIAQLRAAESADGHGHVLQVLLAFLCRYDDLGELYRLVKASLLFYLVFPDDALLTRRPSAARVAMVKTALWDLACRYLKPDRPARARGPFRPLRKDPA